MIRPKHRIWILALGLTVAACGIPQEGKGTQPTPTTNQMSATTGDITSPSTGSPGFVSTGELDVIVLPDENGEYPPDLMVTCPSGPSFPIGALDQLAPIPADDPDSMLAAIEPFLAGEEGQFWPQEGWQLLHESPEEAILVTPTEENLAYMFLTRRDEGWSWSGSSINGNPCELQYAIPEGLNTVEWRLDPSGPQPGPDATGIDVLLTERECVSGREIGDRLLGPQVVMSDTEVRIAFAAEPPPGDAQDCQGNPEMAYTVDLPEPLGDRDVVEGMSVGIRLEDYVR